MLLTDLIKRVCLPSRELEFSCRLIVCFEHQTSHYAQYFANKLLWQVDYQEMGSHDQVFYRQSTTGH